jgi:1-acyl-sn-glycerol-3-phosphate acyltransferase
VSHFRPVYDFVRISILNTVLCILALVYGWPRKLLRGLRQAFYTVYSFSAFLIFAFALTLYGFFLITLAGRVSKRDNKLKFHRVLQRVARFVITRVPGTTFTYTNPTGENFRKPAVIISNHQSHLDLMGIMMLTPNLIILTKKWVWHNPFYGLIIRYADFFPVSETEEMTQKIAEMVQKGYSVMIFPEGTRSEDCHIQRFHRGAFYLAEQLGLDILPVFIDGFGTVLPKKSFHLHPGHMSVEVMPRIPPTDYRKLTKQMHAFYVKKRSMFNVQ